MPWLLNQWSGTDKCQKFWRSIQIIFDHHFKVMVRQWLALLLQMAWHPSVNYFDTIFHITRPLILAVYVNIHWTQQFKYQILYIKLECNKFCLCKSETGSCVDKPRHDEMRRQSAWWNSSCHWECCPHAFQLPHPPDELNYRMPLWMSGIRMF